MTVNDLAGESQGTETRVLVSLQWPSDSTMTRQVALQVPFELHPRGKPLSCAWGVQGQGGSIRGSEQSSKVAGQEATWRNWDLLVVPGSSTTHRSRQAPLLQQFLLSSFPPILTNLSQSGQELLG